MLNIAGVDSGRTRLVKRVQSDDFSDLADVCCADVAEPLIRQKLQMAIGGESFRATCKQAVHIASCSKSA